MTIGKHSKIQYYYLCTLLTEFLLQPKVIAWCSGILVPVFYWYIKTILGHMYTSGKPIQVWTKVIHKEKSCYQIQWWNISFMDFEPLWTRWWYIQSWFVMNKPEKIADLNCSDPHTCPVSLSAAIQITLKYFGGSKLFWLVHWNRSFLQGKLVQGKTFLLIRITNIAEH